MFGLRGILFVMLIEIHNIVVRFFQMVSVFVFVLLVLDFGYVFIAFRHQCTTVGVFCGIVFVVGSPNGYNNCMVISEYA